LSGPCHPTGVCKNTIGGFSCSCPQGTVGEPTRDKSGCKRAGQCSSDAECPDSALCSEGVCRDACDGACGKNAVCNPVRHTAVCSCPSQTVGDPLQECRALECLDGGNDCPESQTCINNKCVNPCTLEHTNVCGLNTNCSVVNHQVLCTCLPGHSGDPRLGCVSVIPCSETTLCPSSSKCSNGICTPVCSSHRDCLSEQLCIEGVCQGTCKLDSECASFQQCLNGICQEIPRCQKDTDCSDDEMCRKNQFGQSECQHVCNNWALCGRNAMCHAKNHEPLCECKEGFHGNPRDDRLGCQPIECKANSDCPNEKTCSNFRCEVACRVQNPCAEFSVCISDKHAAQCQCQPGFTGNPAEKCTPIDFCSQKPCGPGAVCDNARGSYKCLCPIGTVGDPYSQGCLPVPECTTNAECPESTECIRKDGSLKCSSVCDTVKCGPNAICSFRSHQGFCQCREGYEGNPKDLSQGCVPKPLPCTSNANCVGNSYCDGKICKPSCSNDRDCSPNEVCSRNQCSNPCDVTNACGLNGQCSISQHKKVCSCPPGFTGNAEVECVRSK
jgi:hypothetical protein